MLAARCTTMTAPCACCRAADPGPPQAGQYRRGPRLEQYRASGGHQRQPGRSGRGAVQPVELQRLSLLHPARCTACMLEAQLAWIASDITAHITYWYLELHCLCGPTKAWPPGMGHRSAGAAASVFASAAAGNGRRTPTGWPKHLPVSLRQLSRGLNNRSHLEQVRP